MTCERCGGPMVDDLDDCWPYCPACPIPADDE